MTDRSSETLFLAADVIERLAVRATTGRWTIGGLLLTRPEIIAEREEGTEHVAEARANSARWIVAMQPAVAPHLVAWLRAAAEHAEQTSTPTPDTEHALGFAHAVLGEWTRQDAPQRERTT